MSAELKDKYNKLHHQFLGISVREQALAVLTGLAAVIGLMYMLLLEPLILENDKLGKALLDQKNEIQNTDLTLVTLMGNQQVDPNQVLREREQVLDGHIEALDGQLQNEMVNLVPANKMPLLLETVLFNTKGLKVVELRSIPPTPMLQNENKDQDQELDDGLNLFRHGISLTLEGEYFDIQRYLQKMESLEWQFYWKKFDYAVGEYPVARVQLELYTLSTNKAFIGV